MNLDPADFRIAPFAAAWEARAEVSFILMPPPDINVAEAAELYRGLSNPGGGYSGPWRHNMAMPLVEPMEALTDVRYQIVVVVAPAQSGKTEIGLNFCCWTVAVDPADFQIVLPEKQQAKDFSGRRLDRMVDNSPEVATHKTGSSEYEFSFDGCIVNLSWPTSANASSKPVPRNWLDERDSMSDDVDGEGDPVALYHKRSQTFGSRRMTLVTSSPKRPKVKGSPKPTGRHEAVTTTGILALFNEGTRRLMYWPCRECGEYFVTRFKDLQYAQDAKASDEKVAVWFGCPECGAIHGEEDRQTLWGRRKWLAETETIDAAGVVSGTPAVTHIDSYRQFGPQASFIKLEELVKKFLRAEEIFKKTGNDAELRTFWNVDAGEVYESNADTEALNPEDLRTVAGDLPLAEVPAWSPLLVASIDVQSDRFEVMWTTFGPANEGAIVDHTKIVAVRQDGTAVTTGRGSGGAENASDLEACDPAGDPAHWRALVAAVFDKPLPLTADPSRGLCPAMVSIDTGGKAGATANAYAFARWLRRFRPDLHKRAMFLKGTDKPNPMRVWKSQWDAKTTSKRPPSSAPRKAVINRSGVDLFLVATNLLKDAVKARLQRSIKTKGARGEATLHVSAHLAPAVFDQLCAESRDEDGNWANDRRLANEAWDLAVYALAAFIRLGGERIDWTRPPSFAVAERMARPVATETTKPAPASRRRRGLFSAAGRL